MQRDMKSISFKDERIQAYKENGTSFYLVSTASFAPDSKTQFPTTKSPEAISKLVQGLN
jgi:hypothetical protein